MTDRNIIQRGELNMRLARGLEVRQRSGEGLLLADQVVPIVTLEDLTKQSLAIEPGERRAYAATQGKIAAVAAQAGLACVFNPVGSNSLLVVRGFHAYTASTQEVAWGLIDPLGLPAGLMTPWWSDPRNSGIPLANVRQGTDGALRIVTELTRTTVGTTTMQTLIDWPADFALVLVEGTGFGGESAVVNQAIGFSFIWDEVPLR